MSQRVSFHLFDLNIGVNGLNPTVARAHFHTHHVTMSILFDRKRSKYRGH